MKIQNDKFLVSFVAFSITDGSKLKINPSVVPTELA